MTSSPSSPFLLKARLVTTLETVTRSLQLLEVPTTESSRVLVYKPHLAGVNVSSFLLGLQLSPQSRSLPLATTSLSGTAPFTLPPPPPPFHRDNIALRVM